MSILTEPHIRKNILTGDEILVSPHRTKRPWQGRKEDLQSTTLVEYDPDCYLCPGNKRANGAINPDYKNTFVFKNDFAALKEDTNLNTYKNGLLEAKGERGICKVVCFSPNHALTLAKMTVSDIEKVIETWQNEFQALSKIEHVNNIQIFENRGDIMGCSNPHPHGQIWAQHSIPGEIKKKTKRFKKYINNHKETLLEAYINQEIAIDERIIYTNDSFIVIVPFWAVWPYETMIIPKKASENILSLNTKEIADYADTIKKITSTYDNIFDVSFPYSAGIHQAPLHLDPENGWHWHMSFYPPLLRSATVKKFMVGYEMFAMPQRDITAEKAAEILKELI